MQSDDCHFLNKGKKYAEWSGFDGIKKTKNNYQYITKNLKLFIKCTISLMETQL